MNYNILVVIVIAIFGSVLVAALAKEFRHAFLVSEGYAGLLYHKGKFVGVLGAGRHIRWGRHFTLGAQDLRKGALVASPGTSISMISRLPGITTRPRRKPVP